jgi:outer membrane protein assembly factor BamB
VSFHTFHRFLLVIAGLFVCFQAMANQPGANQYPQNPLRLGDSIYLSHQGVYRFDSEHAEPRWSSLKGIQTFAPVAFRNLLLVGSTQGLYALDTSDGSLVWHIEKQHTLFTPSIAGQAYAGSVHGELYAIALEDGAIAWRKSFAGWIYSPAISDNSKTLWSGGQAHEVYAVDSNDGELKKTITTSQESVFAAVELGHSQVGFNLFDGSTLIIDSDSKQVDISLAGKSQPTGIMHNEGFIFRSHSDGSLVAFNRDDMTAAWQHSLVPHNLTMHSSLPDYLLIGDRDRKLFLLDLANPDLLCEIDIEGQRLLPMLFDKNKIIYFQKTMQPTGLKLVKTPALCI